MNWWDELAGNKQYPSVPEREVEGDFRFPAAILCLLSGACLIVAGIVALFLSTQSFALWAIALAITLILCGGWLIPSDRPRK